MEQYGTMPCWTGQINRRILPPGDDSKGGRPKRVICKKGREEKRYQSIRQCLKQTGWKRKQVIAGEADGWIIVLIDAEME